VVYGASAIGGIVTTINSMYTVVELTHQLKDSGASYIVTIPRLNDKVLTAASKLGIKNVFVYGEDECLESLSKLVLSDDGSMFRFYEPIDWKNEIVFLPYSSGTTGLPKGVMLTHYNMVVQALIAGRKSQTGKAVIYRMM